MDFDLDKEPLGTDKDGKEVFLRDIWPSLDEVNEFVTKHVKSEMFKSV